MERNAHHETSSRRSSDKGSDHDDDGGDFGDRVAVVQVNGGDEYEAEIVMMFNDAKISVTVFTPSEASGSSQEKLIVDLIRESFDEDAYEAVLDKILDILLPAGEEEFRRVAPKTTRQNNNKLHAFLYPQTHYFVFRREALDAKPIMAPMSSSDIQSRWDYASYDNSLDPVEAVNGTDQLISLLSLDGPIPRYTTMDLDVQEELSSSGTVTRVHVVPCDNKDVVAPSVDLLCKATNDASGLMASPALRRELSCLATLHQHNYQAPLSVSTETTCVTIRTPRLIGLVTHAETGRVVGFVREWIHGQRLADILQREKQTEPKPSILHLKHRWAQQLRASVNGLHALGLVWGDGKTGNLIVGVGVGRRYSEGEEGLDRIEEAPGSLGGLWLIDFGGGWTNGWVDGDKENTIQGDEQAVCNILEALRS